MRPCGSWQMMPECDRRASGPTPAAERDPASADPMPATGFTPGEDGVVDTLEGPVSRGGSVAPAWEEKTSCVEPPGEAGAVQPDGPAGAPAGNAQAGTGCLRFRDAGHDDARREDDPGQVQTTERPVDAASPEAADRDRGASTLEREGRGPRRLDVLERSEHRGQRARGRRQASPRIKTKSITHRPRSRAGGAAR